MIWYVLIGLSIVAAIVFLAFNIQGSLNSAVDNWVRLTVFTVVIFGTLLKWAWKYRQRAKFWLLYFSFAAVHCAVFIPLFSKERWPTLAMGLLASVETMGLVGITLWLMRSEHERRSHRDG
jgi:hypothetical protein